MLVYWYSPYLGRIIKERKMQLVYNLIALLLPPIQYVELYNLTYLCHFLSYHCFFGLVNKFSLSIDYKCGLYKINCINEDDFQGKMILYTLRRVNE